MHTPKPWKYYNRHYPAGPAIIPKMGPGICSFFNESADLRGDEEHDANGYIMAAAPDLLEVLQQVEWTNAIDGELCCPWCGNYREHGHRQDCPRQAAIAKAEPKVGGKS